LFLVVIAGKLVFSFAMDICVDILKLATNTLSEVVVFSVLIDFVKKAVDRRFQFFVMMYLEVLLLEREHCGPIFWRCC